MTMDKKARLFCFFWSLFKPALDLGVSEWAAQNRYLPAHKTPEPGLWKNERTPYLAKIMDMFNEVGVEEIVFCSATQVGKTQVILNMLGYAIDCQPDPILVVYPSEDVGKDIFKDYIKPMIDSCPTLKEKVSESVDDTTLTRMAFKNGAILTLAWANSPSKLASKPIRYLFLDEVDKYPTNVAKEASPIELAKERTTNFINKKIIMVSTPTTEAGHIWQAFQNADVHFYYFVPCPHCGTKQKLKFEQVKWDTEVKSYSEVEKIAYYECEKCKKKIYDYHKPQMLEKGVWKPDNRVKDYKTVGFHLSGLYSPWRTFGQFARKFLETKSSPEKLQNFINSWLAEPWKDNTEVMKQEEAIEELKKYMFNEQGKVPKDAVALTAGIDVQENCFYFVIRAWGTDLTSWLILEGIAADWEQLAKIIFLNRYPVEGSTDFMTVEKACIDSGYRTKEVYQFVQQWYPLAIAIKGASTDLGGRPFEMPSQKAFRQLGKAAPFRINTNYYKDFISLRRRIPVGEAGAWYIYQGVSNDYLKQITSEIVVKKRNSLKWEPRTTNIKNHLWDAEVYATAAADMLQVWFREKKEKPKNQVKKGEFNTRNADWLPKQYRRNNWL